MYQLVNPLWNWERYSITESFSRPKFWCVDFGNSWACVCFIMTIKLLQLKLTQIGRHQGTSTNVVWIHFLFIEISIEYYIGTLNKGQKNSTQWARTLSRAANGPAIVHPFAFYRIQHEQCPLEMAVPETEMTGRSTYPSKVKQHKTNKKVCQPCVQI